MSEWVEKPLKYLVSFKKGKKVETSDLALDGYQPYLGASSLTGGEDGFALPAGGVACADSDALMLWDGERSGLVGPGKPGVISSTVMRLRPEGEMAGRYLVHYLRDRFDWIQARRTGTGVPHVPKDLGRILELRFPKSEAMQTKICNILDTLDTQIEATEGLIAKQERVRAGLMQDLFTRGVDEHGQLRPPRAQAPHLYHQTELGWLPLGWETGRLLDLSTRIVDGVHHTPKYTTQGIPFVTVKSLTAGRGIDTKQGNYISLSDHRIFQSRADPKVGDVLVTKDGTLGVARYVDEAVEEFSIFVSVAMLRPIASLLNPLFLCEFFSTKFYESQMGYLSAGSGLKHIHLEHFRKFILPLPSRAEQITLMEILGHTDLTVSTLESALAKLRLQKSGLMQDLLTGKVSVAPLLKEAAA